MFGSYSRGSAPDWRTMLNSHPLFQDTAPHTDEPDPNELAAFAKNYIRNKAPQQQSDISPGWEGLVGAGEGLANAVPVVRSNVISPVEMAPAPNTTPGWIRGTGQLAGDITGGVLETVGGTAAGLPLGPAGAIAGAAGAAAYGSAAENAEQHRIDEMRRREQELGPQATPTQAQIDPGRWEGGWKQLDTGDAVEAALNAATAGLGTKLGLSGAQALRELVQSKAAPEVVRNLALREGGKQVAADIGMGAATSPVSVLNQQNVNPFTDPELAMQTLADNKGQLLWDTALNAAISGGGQLPTFARALRGGDQLIADTQALLEREKAIASQPKPQPIEERAPNKFMDAMSNLRQKTAELIGGKKLVPEEQLRQEVERRAEAERMADTDEMTGLANKNAFVRAKDSADADAKSSFATFDMNNFKAVNDIEGHEAGDKMLAAVGDALRAARDETNQNIRIFRTGGDEFTAIGPKATMQQFRDLAEARFGERGRYKTSLSGEVADTFSAADAGLKARKEARKKSLGVAQTREEMDALIEAEKRRMEGGDVLEEGQAGRQAEVLDVSGVDPGFAEINSSAAIQAGDAPEFSQSEMEFARAPGAKAPDVDAYEPPPKHLRPKMEQPDLAEPPPPEPLDAGELEHNGKMLRGLGGEELFDLSDELIDNLRVMGKKEGKDYLGYFAVKKDPESGGQQTEIGVRGDLAKDRALANKILAHELGHGKTRLSQEQIGEMRKVLPRDLGNVLGHIAGYRRYADETLDDLFDTPNGPYSNEQITKELTGLSEFLRPFDRTKATPEEIAYRDKPAELVADGYSAFLLSPKETKARAPQFFSAVMDLMERRPQFKEAYDGIQEYLSRPEAERADIKQAAFEKDFDTAAKQQSEAIAKRKATEDSFLTTLKDLPMQMRESFTDLFARMTKLAEKQGGGFRFIDLKQKAMRRTAATDIVDTTNEINAGLKEAGLRWKDFGYAMLLERIAYGDRADFFNPRNVDPEGAKRKLARLKERLGPEKTEALYAQMDIARKKAAQLLRKGHKVGRISNERYNALRKHAWHYAPFQVLDYVDPEMSALIEKQTGTFKGVANPGHSLMLKLLAQADYYQGLDLKNAGIEVLLKGGEAEKAKLIKRGDKEIPEQRGGKSIIHRWEDGKATPYYVHPNVARAFETYRSLGLDVNKNAIFRAIRGMNKIQRALHLTMNPYFVFYSQPIRDIERMLMVSPKGAGAGKVLKSYFDARRDSVDYAEGKTNPLLEEMIKGGVLTRNQDGGIYGGTPDNPLGQVHEALGLKEKRDPAAELKEMNAVKRGAVSIGRWMEKKSTASEVQPKVAMYKILREQGMNKDEALHFVRNYVGTPNYVESGRFTPVTNTLFQYSNVMLQGLRSDKQILSRSKNPANMTLSVASKYARRAFGMAAFAAVADTLMENLFPEYYDSISEYDKANYLIIPLPFYADTEESQRNPNAKQVPVYLRVPLQETTRIAKAFITKAKSGGFPGIAEAFGEQTPSLTANMNILAQWYKYVTGQEPFDSFKGRPIVSQVDRDAGNGIEKMMEWTSKEFGLKNLNPTESIARILKNAPVPSVRPEKSPVRQSVREAAEKARAERNTRTAAGREAMAAFDAGDTQAIEQALLSGQISPQQAAYYLKQAGMTTEERFLQGISKDKREEIMKQYGAR